MGIALQFGSSFITPSRTEVIKKKIKIHKTGKLVYIDGDVKPLWANDNWNDDVKIQELYEMYGVEYRIDEHIVDSDSKLEFYTQCML